MGVREGTVARNRECREESTATAAGRATRRSDPAAAGILARLRRHARTWARRTVEMRVAALTSLSD
ncbi:MAG: hypothetical protein ABEJ30_04915 [Halorientalis sp.]